MMFVFFVVSVTASLDTVPLAMKAARLNALIRSVYVLVQSKPLVRMIISFVIQ